MSPFKDVGREFQFNFGHLKRLIPIIAIFFIPVLYAGIFLWAFWNPYGNLNRLPVAVVNQDQGATYDGKQIQAGQQLVNQLRKNNEFKWSFVSSNEAKTGLTDNRYDMVITIPKDFSDKAAHAATTLGAPQPKLVSVTNDRHNYIAGIIGRNAMISLQEQTAQQLAKTDTTQLVTGIQQLETGLHKAANGATQVASGAAKLTNQNHALVQGAAQLASGSNALLVHLQQAQSGATAVENGAAALNRGNQQLSRGLGQLSGAGKQLQASSSQLQTGAAKLKAGLLAGQTGTQQTASGANQLAEGLQAYLKAHPALAQDPQFQALVQASQKLATGSAQLAAGSGQLVQGASQLMSGESALQSGLVKFNQQLQTAQQGAAQMAKQTPQLVAGAQQLTTGLGQLQAGASSLQTGAGALSSGVHQYANGATQIASGASNLADQLQKNAKNMPSIHQKQVVSAISDPVGVNQQQAGNITNYGNGFMPYFLSLGLFVGALLMSIVIPFRDPSEKPSSGFAWFLSKALLVGLVGVVQSLLADAILLYGLGVHVNSIVPFVLFSMLTSVTFVSIIQFFVTTMANPGRFLAVIVMILQLTTSSGTYPVVLSPAFFQNISPYLPMTYTVAGFRYLGGGGKLAFFQSDIWHLFAYWVAFLALTLVYFLVRYHKQFKNDHPQTSTSAVAEA
ncbi:YhgE/Pip family protein [Alicyclobacillus fodiniaquatilis]|uniref:YhgE/Pip family protein n=1 Tax=Alicyclobacillus fodiniaquatilis TaxID=1661150 RepID=A0ABW4JCA8_9BACL